MWGTALSETSTGEGAGLCYLESAPWTLGMLFALTLQMREEAQRKQAPMPQSKLKEGAALALSSREPYCPERGRLSLGIPLLGGTGVRVGVPHLAC